MKKYLKGLLKTPMVFVFVMIIACYGLGALGETAEINRYAVVSAIGIDRSEDDAFEISLLTFIPIAEQTFTETYKVISSKGQSVSEAMDYAGLYIGRKVGLSHVKLIVLNENLVEENISKFLDYLSRSKHMSSSTKMIVTDSSAKEFLKVAEKLDSGSSIKVSELIAYNSEYIYATDSSLELFYKGIFGPTGTSLIPCILLEEGGDVGLSAGSNSSQDAGSQDTAQSQPKIIINNGDTIVCKDGKKVAKITGEDIKKINLFKNDFNSGVIKLENFSDEHFNNANLTFEILDKKIKNKVIFENHIPVFNINMDLYLILSEVENDSQTIEENVEFFDISTKALNEIEVKVRNSMADGIDIMRENKTDLVDFYTVMHNANVKEFNKFLNSLQDQDDYLDEIIFKVSVNIHLK